MGFGPQKVPEGCSGAVKEVRRLLAHVRQVCTVQDCASGIKNEDEIAQNTCTATAAMLA
jgi:hypothetical protein